MTPRRGASLTVSALVLISCGDDNSGTGDASFSTTVPTTTMSATTESSATTDASDASGSEASTETTGSEPNLGVCEDYIDCAMEAMPETIATLIATYGPEGSCWSLPGVTEEDCWTECTAQLANLRAAYPDAEACWECPSDAECIDPAPWCDLVEHRCLADLTSCDARTHWATCYEGPPTSLDATWIDQYCLSAEGVVSAGHCPVEALLGTCTRWMDPGGGDSPDGSLTYVYVTPPLPKTPPYDLATAEARCTNSGGQWQPGPP